MPCVSASHPASRLAFVLTVYTCIATLPSAAAGQTTQPASDDAAVQSLLNKLASDDWAERHEAQSRLAAMAEAAEPRLRRAAQDSDDAEVRTRCNAALAQICENRLIGPTLITLQGATIDPQTACAELARQLDVALEPRDRTLWDRQLSTLAIDADRRPLWDVVRELRSQCGLDLEPAGGARLAIIVVPEAQRATPTSTYGPFRVRPARIARSATIDLAGGGGVASTEFTFTVMVQAEPKLSVSRASRLVRLEMAEDENGVSLLPADDGGPRTVINRSVTSGDTMRPGTAWWSAMGRLEYPAAGAGKRIARLKGSASCALLVHSETIEVPDALNARNVVKGVGGGAEVTIKSCRRVGTTFEVQVAGPRTVAGLDAMRTFRGQTTEGARLLLMPQGTELPLQGSRSSTNAQGVDVTLRFGAANAPADADVKLVWQVATDVRNVEIPFEFADLPLP